ncbi:hypothetical protein BDF21DRAFT_432101 [Thamnidium elegans]|nr:hypothetical protein BDF21DRAFT_432101 [Thamnidium elegans]
MSNLPTEVYYSIFRIISRSEIHTCSFVCRRWNIAATQVYCQELTVNEYKIDLAK